MNTLQIWIDEAARHWTGPGAKDWVAPNLSLDHPMVAFLTMGSAFLIASLVGWYFGGMIIRLLRGT